VSIIFRTGAPRPALDLPHGRDVWASGWRLLREAAARFKPILVKSLDRSLSAVLAFTRRGLIKRSIELSAEWLDSGGTEESERGGGKGGGIRIRSRAECLVALFSLMSARGTANYSLAKYSTRLGRIVLSLSLSLSLSRRLSRGAAIAENRFGIRRRPMDAEAHGKSGGRMGGEGAKGVKG